MEIIIATIILAIVITALAGVIYTNDTTNYVVAINSDSGDNDINQVELAWFSSAEVTTESLGLDSITLLSNDLAAIGGEVTGWSCQPMTGQDILYIEVTPDLIDMITTPTTTAIITTPSLFDREADGFEAYASAFFGVELRVSESYGSDTPTTTQAEKAHQDLVLEYRHQHKAMILERVARRHFENRATQVLVEEGYPESTVVLGRPIPLELLPETWEEFMWALPVEKEMEGDDLSWTIPAPSQFWEEVAEEVFLTME